MSHAEALKTNSEIAARLNEWADALDKYGSEQRRDVDGEIVWWMRKASAALAAGVDPE